MNRTLAWTLLLIVVAFGIASAETQKFAVDGIPVILKTNPGTPVVSASFVLQGGLPYYGVEQAGVERMLLQVAQKGSMKYPKDDLQTLLARTGSRVTAEAERDLSYLSLTCLRQDLKDVWPAFADVVVHPALDSMEVALERERQLNTVRQARDDPDSYLRILADELHYAGHPYAVSPMGTEETVAACNADVLRAYHTANVTRGRALIVIAGDVDRPTAERLVRSGFGSLPEEGYSAAELRLPERERTADTRLEKRELPTNYVIGYYDVPSLDDADYIPTRIALSILRDRLFEEVRTKRNLTYAVSSGLSTRRDNYGMLYVTAVEPDSALRVMLAEVKKMQTDGISDKELNDQRKVLITRYLMDQQTNASQAEELGRYEILGGGWANADKVVEQMRSVTPEDIRRVCAKYIRDIDFVMLGDPQKWKDPLAADQPAGDKGKLD